ncbi:putative Translation machinery associated protein 16 [Trypanosoma vivax]|uniref:Uncharacterized protein n=1 Tax=Trypanosoma vivax (strain Y486) TaxID=1055687 RepID=G0U748_TRYVY|nr:hypothetical protein TRVL_05341 [Trypanosoma vivax]KAH8620392.1 putative Translation machinery associated protein 16 [Trypanosoma vivax]CCC51705.1 conserved hypothetical protein [Trypanosoma vivax Y486]
MVGKGIARTYISHPKARKVRQLERQTRRQERLSVNEEKRHAKALLECTRFIWFREQCLALGRTQAAFSHAEAKALTTLYVSRNDEELAALKNQRNPPVGRIKTIEALKTSELDLFNSSKGIAIPDIMDSDNLEILTTIWDGRANTIGVVPRVALCCADPVDQATLDVLKAKLLPVDEVREKAAPVTPKRALKFQVAKRKESVKKLADAQGVAQRSRKRASEAQQKRLKMERKSALNALRGL